MKTPSKFFSRKGKKSHSLLSDVDIEEPKYYEVIAPTHNPAPKSNQTMLGESESQARDDSISYGSMPYQIAQPVAMMKGKIVRGNPNHPPPANVFDLQFPQKLSFQEDEWKYEGLDPSTKGSNVITNERASSKKDTVSENKPTFTQNILSVNVAVS